MAMPVCVGGRLTESGNGYYLVGADGGVFAYGDAVFHGSIPALGLPPLAHPIVGFDIMPGDKGYQLYGGDYGVYAFGDAPYLGHPTYH